LIVGIGRGTKSLSQYLACTKTYETVVLFGTSTDSYDCTGTVGERAECGQVTKEMVEEKLEGFKGTIRQMPPVYSALKINGMKAVEYVRQGLPLPRELESREMQVDECMLLDFYTVDEHTFHMPGEQESTTGPAVRVKLTVSSGFYVRSFAHDLGIACDSRSHMTSLLRTRQADFTICDPPEPPDLIPTLTYADLEAGEEVWGPKLRPQLEKWVEVNPLNLGHVNGRDESLKRKLAAERGGKPRQRFRGEWVADTKKERIKQQGGKFKGKWGLKKETVAGDGIHQEGDKVEDFVTPHNQPAPDANIQEPTEKATDNPNPATT
jgi:tRNA pseudouridine55 synthase